MSILNDMQVRQLCEESGMIEPFHPMSIRTVALSRKVFSYGVSSYGYDVTLDRQVKIFTNQNGVIVDPKRLDEASLADARILVDEDGALYSIIPPNSYMLSVTREYFRMPRDVVAIAVGKSSYARAGLIINVTPIEPGFEGNVVIEIANSTSLPVKVYLEEGIAQFLFFRGEACEVSYADRAGKYQGQTGITLPKV